MNITIAGIGYVGLSNMIFFAQKNNVIAFDIDEIKIKQLQQHKIMIKNDLMKKEIQKSNFIATRDEKEAFSNAEVILISTPTDYNEKLNYFDISSIENIIQTTLNYNTKALFIIKSTIPIGCVEYLIAKYKYENIVFCPEFLREDYALQDLLQPNRIIFGFNQQNTQLKQQIEVFVNKMLENINSEIPILYMNSREAEAVKLFSNTYLAMRISFFNEIDTYAELKNLNSKDIIAGVGADPRIGNFYNNPSFGYGGYCLPKDTKQLMANYADIPEDLISAIVKANTTRKKHIVDMILKQIDHIDKPTVGIYRLLMKSNSDNFRQSAIQDIITTLKYQCKIDIIIYEPLLKNIKEWNGCKVINNFDDFKNQSSLIVANRYNKDLKDIKQKIYTRDIFFCN